MEKIKNFESKLEILKTMIFMFKKLLKDWLLKYLKLRPTENHQITPYIHTFVFHLGELTEKHKNINIYSCQGLERLNEFIKKMYFCSSNKNNYLNSFLRQIILKRNRIELYLLKVNLSNYMNN